MSSVDHIGIAVKKPGAVIELYRRLLGVKFFKEEEVDAEGIRTHFLRAGSTKLELLESIHEGSPVDKFLHQKGEGMHHVAFEVRDIDTVFKRARNLGYTLLSDEPYEGADGKLVFFIHPKETHGVLVECCQQATFPFEQIDIPFESNSLGGFLAGNEEAPNILLLHGAAGSTMMDTAPLLHRLAERYRVLGLDFSGHGTSESTDKLFSNDLFLENIQVTLDHVGWDSSHIIGFSMGGAAALQFVDRYPDRVARVAVHSTHLNWSDEDVSRMQRRLSVNAIQPEVLANWEDHHDDLETVFEKTRQYIQKLPSYAGSWKSMLESINHNVLVSAHDRDPLFPLTSAISLTEHLPNNNLCVLPGSSHTLPSFPLDEVLHQFLCRS